ncbi:hypothetical protein [Streptomyces formicae]|uniref:Uncharacterized protein n=1 Tax=Streptomyces formicae TaxID=1616117 RepID=A0A291Q7T7_9ACTN|nr:hypothetical protein [Streptomyces formicae]ATL27781.1 hypothetical protein KY5_2763 [Streptomyces formicae]
MTDPSKRCLNCADSFQNFQRPEGGALDFVVARVGLADSGKYWRCGRSGCRRVQNYFNYRDGFDLPPPP